MKRYHGDDYTFIINRVKLEDRGEYVIRAENHYGYREEVVFLNVQRMFPIVYLPGNSSAFPGDGTNKRANHPLIFSAAQRDSKVPTGTASSPKARTTWL